MGIPYFVGGSLASSVHGVARATLNADIIARLEPERQWRGVLGILRVAGQGLDGSYLSLWAGELGVADLLHRALGQAEPRAR